jgi:ribosome maturation factor RimP
MNHTEAQEIKAGVDLARVRAAIGPVLSAHGVVLVDLEWLTERSGWVLRITIEREGSTEQGGGVTLEDCAEVSRGASAVLDVEDLIPQHYHLEVSSPGIDRPLRSAAEIARFAGRTAKVKLRHPAPDGQRVLRGLLDAAPEGKVAVIVDGKRIEVPYPDVAEANLVFELAAQPKKAPSKKKSAGARQAETTRSQQRPARSS